MNLSRPERWKIAVRRATEAVFVLEKLHGEWADRLEQLGVELEILRKEAVAPHATLDSAREELHSLQQEYEHKWNVPENLSDADQARLDDVRDFDFQYLDAVSELEFALAASIRKQAFEYNHHAEFGDAVSSLEEARKLTLPKGYGRD